MTVKKGHLLEQPTMDHWNLESVRWIEASILGWLGLLLNREQGQGTVNLDQEQSEGR